MDKVPVTTSGFASMEEEVRQLKTVERHAVIAAIAEAREHGDLSENAEYDAAKEQQGFIEGRIKELEAALSVAEIIDPTKLGVEDKVVFGAHVKLFDDEKDVEVDYQLVGNLEANINKGRVSISSPIGRAMIGKEVGDDVVVDAPSGKKTYEILSVSYS